MPKTNSLKDKFVEFIGCPNQLYKVLDEKGKYILVDDGICAYWERKEYIEYVYLEFVKKYVEF